MGLSRASRVTSVYKLRERAILVGFLCLLQTQPLTSFSTNVLWGRQCCHPRQRQAGRRYPLSHPPSRRRPCSLPHDAASSPEPEDFNFERLSRIHAVVQKLRLQIPTLLSRPLTDASSKAVYRDDVKLVVDEIELASSREELQALSTTFGLAVRATNQANSFFANALGPARSTAADPQSSSTLESTMVMDPRSQAIRVQWKVTLPGQASGQNQKLKGVSELELDPRTGKVATLRLLSCQFNQESLNARAIAESLSSLRQLVLAFQNSPLGSGLPALTSLLGSDILLQVSRQQSSEVTMDASPLFITDSLGTAFACDNIASPSSTATNDTTTMIPIDDFRGNASLPLPGSRAWTKYVAARRVFATFRQTTLRVLSGNLSVAPLEMVELFAPQAVLKATDGSELLRGRDPVGKFFQTLASFRKRSSGTWALANATLLDYNDQVVTIAVEYRATTSVPRAGDVVMEGTDHFVLDSPVLDLDGTEADDDDISISIQQIEQRKLVIGGGGVGNRSSDGLWFVKSLVALDAGRLGSVGADSVVMELLQRVIAGENGRLSSDGSGQKRKRRRIPPRLSETVAARVYAILSGLHEEVPTLFEKDMLRTYQLPPLYEFLSKDVELRGYLGETLARGLASYNTALGTTFASLKGALATGGARLDRDPVVTVELTAEGHARLRLSVDLRVLPLPSGAGDLINSISGSAISLPSGGFPLKFAIVSDYVIDKDSGEIYQHRLVETRINDQLTAGDVISKWIQKQLALNPKGGEAANDSASVQRGLMDAISWVRSASGRG